MIYRKKELKSIKSDEGAIIAEASFVMPVIIIVIFILIYLALIQIQQAIMQMYAYEVAQNICNISTFPGYEYFYQEAWDEEKRLELTELYEPSPHVIDMIYSVHNPYRYLGGIYLNKHNNYKEQLKDIVQNSLYFNGGEIITDIDVAFENLSSSIKVRVGYSFKLPRFISLIGINPNIMIKGEAIIYANDTAEFIRNTDLAFDLFEHFLKKYNLDKKINTFYKKIKEFSK